MIDFKVNNQAVSIPTSWDEVTYKQYCEILNSDSSATAFLSIFTGINCETLNKSKIIGLDGVLIAMSFASNIPKAEGYYPQIGPYKLPPNKDGKFNIQFESLAQFEDMKAIYRKLTEHPDAKEMAIAYGRTTAIYLQSIRDGEYNPEAAKQMVESEISGFPAMQVISMGAFFFSKLVTLLLGTNPNFPHTAQNQKKSKQGTTSSHRRSGHTGRSRKRR